MRNAAALTPGARAAKLFRLVRPDQVRLELVKPEDAELNELEFHRAPMNSQRALLAASAGLAVLTAVAAATWAVRHRNRPAAQLDESEL